MWDAYEETVKGIHVSSRSLYYAVSIDPPCSRQMGDFVFRLRECQKLWA
jgi:hypothetical protein